MFVHNLGLDRIMLLLLFINGVYLELRPHKLSIILLSFNGPPVPFGHNSLNKLTIIAVANKKPIFELLLIPTAQTKHIFPKQILIIQHNQPLHLLC